MYDPVDKRHIYMTVTIGTVVDTNDPQQEGRIRVQVPAYGDRPYADTQDLPWAIMASPYMGMVSADDASRGPTTDANTNGQVAYGFWNTPKVGAAVLITCINGDPMVRVCLGCIPIQTTSHTMPGGRYLYNTDQLESQGEPEGPLSSAEASIQPLYDNQTAAFGSRQDNYEYRTRGAEHQLMGLTNQIVNLYQNDIDTTVPDDMDVEFTEGDGNVITSTQGYRATRVDGTGIKDSNVSAWVSSAFHAISMDDSADNCRVRIRTSSGAQIILDDTNERIYINTAKGNNWIELDEDGSINVYGARISYFAEEDINFTAGKTIRMFANGGIHLVSSDVLYIQTESDISIASNGNIRTASNGNYYIQGAEVNIVGGILYLSSVEDINLNAIGGSIYQTGLQIQLNGPPALVGDMANPQLAFWTNIVPQHEPWGRMTTLDDTTHESIYDYNDPLVGRQFTTRNPNWHR